jgi:uncharacterized alpha-E superfamily protein
VLEGLLALSGLAIESMVRDAGWYVMDAGRRIERSLQLISLLRHALAEQGPLPVDELVVESVLIAAESVITQRRRHPGRPRVDDVLHLLLLDHDNPRALAHQFDRLAEDLGQLPGGGSDGPLQVQLRELQARLREVDPRAMARTEPSADSFAGRPQLSPSLIGCTPS